LVQVKVMNLPNPPDSVKRSEDLKHWQGGWLISFDKKKITAWKVWIWKLFLLSKLFFKIKWTLTLRI
jgi:hypothetical protein